MSTNWLQIKETWKRLDRPAHWHRWRGRIKAPATCHPLVRQFITTANDQMTTLQEIADRAGVSRVAISDWRNSRNPSIVTFNAALNVLGFELCIRKIRVMLPKDGT